MIYLRGKQNGKSAKAILILPTEFEDAQGKIVQYTEDEAIWFPLSQISIDREEDKMVEISVPAWLMTDKGFDKYVGDQD